MTAIMQQLQAWVSASGILADKMAVIMIIALFGLMVVGLVLGQELAFVLGGAGVIIGWLAWGGPGVTIAMTKIYDQMQSYSMVAIPMFVLMANFLTHSKVADGLFESIRYLLGPLKGGLGLAVHFLVAVQTAGLIDPGVVVQSGEVVHNGGQQLERGVLAGPVAAPVAAALNGALTDIIKQLFGGAKLAFGIVSHGKATSGELAEDFAEALIHSEVDVAGTPSGPHLPCDHRQVTVAASHCVGVSSIHHTAVGSTAGQQRHRGDRCQKQCNQFFSHAVSPFFSSCALFFIVFSRTQGNHSTM